MTASNDNHFSVENQFLVSMPQLDERTVHIAAPFDRFPDGIRSETDTLHIVRTWEFRQSRLTARIPKNK